MGNSLEQIKQLCQKYNLVPRRERGQNFLIDEAVLNDIVSAANLSQEDEVLEIGPGFGVLTHVLAQHVKQVVAVELDAKLVHALHERFNYHNNITIVHDDIFKYLNSASFKYSKVVANLPYQITSHILRVLLEREYKPSCIVVMVQKEVAERIAAKPGEMSLLSVMVQYHARPEIIRIVPRSSFWPEPEVDSAIVRIRPFIDPSTSLRMTRRDDTDFFRFVKMGFASRRKQLQNNLSAGLNTPKKRVEGLIVSAGFPLKVRAQELSVDDWKRLMHYFGTF